MSLTVSPVNDVPAARPDQYATDEDTPLTVAAPGVLANDFDAEGDAMTVVPGDAPVHGELTLNANGSLTYVPDADYEGPDSFTYSVSDSGGDGTSESAPAQVRITVGPVADPPVGLPDQFATDEDTTLEVAAPGVLGNDNDADGDALTATLVSTPAHGELTLNADGSLSYVPARDYTGPDSFTYTTSDGSTTSPPVSASITVRPVNDPPLGSGDAYATDEDVALVVAAPGVLGNDADPDGDALTAAVAGAPAHGALTLNADGSLRYVPARDYRGPDSFTYTVSDGSATSAPATVSISVRSVNDAPAGGKDAYSTDDGKPLVIAAPGVLVNDADADGDALTAAVAEAPDHGTLTLAADGSLRYVPAAKFKGLDNFTYRVTDGTLLSAPVDVRIIVRAAPSCTSRSKVKLRVPKVKGRVLRTIVRVGRKKLKVRKGVAVIKLRRPGSTVRVRIEQRVKRGRKVRTVRKTRTFKRCAK